MCRLVILSEAKNLGLRPLAEAPGEGLLEKLDEQVIKRNSMEECSGI